MYNTLIVLTSDIVLGFESLSTALIICDEVDLHGAAGRPELWWYGAATVMQRLAIITLIKQSHYWLVQIYTKVGRGTVNPGQRQFWGGYEGKCELIFTKDLS